MMEVGACTVRVNGVAKQATPLAYRNATGFVRLTVARLAQKTGSRSQTLPFQ